MIDPNVVQTLQGTFRLVVPEIVLVVAACVLFLGGTIRASRHVWGAFALIALVVAGLCQWLLPTPTVPALTVSPIRADLLTNLIRVIALAGGAILVLLSWDGVPDTQAAEYHACLLVATAGMALTGAANELITLFLALELTSIPTYILLYLPRVNRRSQEAAVKYFLLSIFSSALLLFGFSYLYGLAGTTNLTALSDTLARPEALPLPGFALVAVVMVVAGLGFRIAAVPFHFYAPDVYQGAPTPVAALLAFLPKLVGFVALVRVFGFLDGRPPAVLAYAPQLPILLWILAAITMTLGNVLALLQDNLKRLLAYSSVANAGYLLIGLAVAPELGRQPTLGTALGVEAVFFYLVAYAAMTLGAFAALAYLSTPDRPVESIDDLLGLSQSHPRVALMLAVCLFSLIGLPLTAGFAGKAMLILGALTVPTGSGQGTLYRALALIAAVNAAVAAYYYLRVVGVMYLRSPVKPLKPARSPAGLVALTICAVLTLVFGVYPWPLFRPILSSTVPAPVASVTP